MERSEWMNDEVRDEIEELRRRFGFEENEAVAYWHLMQAHRLMARLAIDESDALITDAEAEYADLPLGEREGRLLAEEVSLATKTELRIEQPFAALHRELGRRVLRRDYPEGWADTRI